VWFLLGKVGKVQTSPGQKVLGLSNIHPIALQIKRMQFAITCHLGKNLLFDRRRSQRDSLEDVGIEDVDSGIDPIGDKFNWLFDETFDGRGFASHDDDAVLARFFDFGDDDGAFLAVFFVELGEL
jgi:hypothetical protein